MKKNPFIQGARVAKKRQNGSEPSRLEFFKPFGDTGIASSRNLATTSGNPFVRY